jgi:hypothetical protein
MRNARRSRLYRMPNLLVTLGRTWTGMFWSRSHRKKKLIRVRDTPNQGWNSKAAGGQMLQSDVDRHKGKWLLLVATLMLVLFGILFAIYAKQPSTNPTSNEQPVKS